MPIRITGKIADEFGLPLLHPAVVKEIPASGNTGIADVFADSDTGTFVINVLDPNSMIQVSAYGYETVLFPHTMLVPPVVKLKVNPQLVIDGNRPVAKSDNTWIWWALGGLGLFGLVAASGSSKPKSKAVATKGLAMPKKAKNKKSKQKPLTVIV
jgi:hypothetical protein